MSNEKLSALDQVRKLVLENPALHRQIQQAGDVPAALESIRNFAEQYGSGLDMNQISAGLQQATAAGNVSMAVTDQQLESVLGGVDGLKIFLGIITFGITFAVDAEVDRRRKESEAYGG
jgi:hypothetical protein